MTVSLAAHAYAEIRAMILDLRLLPGQAILIDDLATRLGMSRTPVREALARIQSGMVGINSFALAAAEAPFGGIKYSGMGREGGSEGIADYSNVKLGQVVLP